MCGVTPTLESKVIIIACYHPLKGFIIGYKDKEKSIKNIHITSFNTNHIEITYNNSIIDINESNTMLDHIYKRVDDYIEIPCGHCVGCRLDYAKMWSCRLLCELKSQPVGAKNWFITLTYDDDHLPLCDKNYDDSLPMMSLRKSDFQKFMKRLRKAYPDNKIRYFCAGEYGSSTFRPHYHLILFNCPLDDLQVHSVSNGNIYYHSDKLDSIWSNGFCMIGSVTAESCNYTARYCVKKAFNDVNKDYEEIGIEKEFILMSRKPGIGYEWLMNHDDSFKCSEIYLSTENGGRKFPFPRYFVDKLSELDKNKNFVELVKDSKHRYLINKRELADQFSTKPYLERLADEERVKIKNLRKDRDTNEKCR